jgi:hypothetical protein
MGLAQLGLSTFFHHHDFVQWLQLLWQQKYGQDYLDWIQSSGHDESTALGESSMMLKMLACLGLPSFPKTRPRHLKYIEH